ncbi:sigma-70 family RNA polymerase sigma factor [Streptomyces sp. S.PB5]|uniref:sigma-70 family RNA polymerase sigma factor n=1 Tax=Streptomyces sp. S.PB5 TaxID=3020844 RepID=UPI0025B1D5FB|nr:sigma-70 family RNA polymerase sigma factor [Streptomyces sp. S.PB5]MDN3024798.1 sigma-70 family RNA polymerase sigma factor [Streptomyces sp. S.PB5]
MSDVSTAVPAAPAVPAVPAAEYARIYEEQQPRLVAYARSLTRNAHTAEDLVAEAHFRVWRRLAAGHEIDNVPAYLMTTLRRLASAAGSVVRETPQDPQAAAGEQAEVGRHGDDPAEQVSSVDMVVRVLGQLPERWVKALWLAEAEGQPLAAIGPQLGTKEGATAVLLHRAREGMRQAFLKEQTGAPEDPACQVHWARMPAYVRGAASARQSERLLGHVDACDDCRARLAALMSANDRLPAMVGPALLVFAVGGGAGKFLLGFTGTATAFSSGGAGLLDGVRHASVGGSKAAAAAGAVVVGAAAVFLVLGPVASGPVPAQRTPVAQAPAAQAPVEEPVDEPAAGGDGRTPEGAGAARDTGAVAVAGGGGAAGVVTVRADSRGSGPGSGEEEATGGTTSSAPPAEPAPEEPGGNAPAAPVDDSPKAPEPPSTPAPEPTPDPEPSTPVAPTPVDDPAPAPEEPGGNEPAPAPTPAPDPDPSTPAEPQPEPTTPPPPAPTPPGDDCGGPHGDTGHGKK